MKGYVAVQKKLLTLCYAIWKNDTQYDPKYNSNNVKELENKDKKSSPDWRDYTGCSRLKLLLLLSPKNIKKILFQNLYFKTVPAV